MVEYSEQDKEFILVHLDKETKANLDEVVTDLKCLTTFENVTDIIDSNIIEKYLSDHNIDLHLNFKTQVNSPYSVMKYITLYNQSMFMINKVEEDLSTLITAKNIRWTLYKDLSNKVTFYKVLEENSDEKPQNLDIRYRYDSEEDEIIYSLPSTAFSWDISKQQLKALLENKDMVNIQNTYKTSKDDMILTYNGMKIIITKA